MLIEQIIEFELRRPRPPGRTCTLTTGYFYNKTKISRENLQVNHYLLLNYSGGNVSYFPLPGPNRIQNLTQNAKF